ncbi:hypothetical protein RHMOL_Rhmol03G0154700 [Rhododendron molle]|uniref:Uncharacterized protein n=2 Tax=Rhododendron molle TaxID=49168 RepID=A0ACC0PEK2_RHOML|nr:hypothetical protein RHMOL_Rhmol03G0154700 [Rhododendron molle]
MVARDGLHFAMELGLEFVIIEGDSQQLVHLVQRRKEDHQVVGVLVADILHLLAGFFNSEFL